MATAIEAMGMTLPGSSSCPAVSPDKMRECERAGEMIKVVMERDIRPRDLLSRRALENALVVTMILGGSTNSVLHFLAIASSADVELTIDDIDRTSKRTPLLADLVPSGKHFMEDLHNAGGTPAVLKMLIAEGLDRWLHSNHHGPNSRRKRSRLAVPRRGPADYPSYYRSHQKQRTSAHNARQPCAQAVPSPRSLARKARVLLVAPASLTKSTSYRKL